MEAREKMKDKEICISLSAGQVHIIYNLIRKLCFGYPSEYNFSYIELRVVCNFADCLYAHYFPNMTDKKVDMCNHLYSIISDQVCISETLYLWLMLLFKRVFTTTRLNGFHDLTILVANVDDVRSCYRHLQSYFDQVTNQQYSEDYIDKWYNSFQETVPFQQVGGPADVSNTFDCFHRSENKKYASSYSRFITLGSLAGEQLEMLIEGIRCLFCWIPRGSFIMGSTQSEQLQFCAPDPDNESCCDEQQHRVTLSHGFWMMQYPVTNHFYSTVMNIFEGNDSKALSDRPVVNVTWYDCLEFTKRLNSLYKISLGHWQFSLPTEAQWEYACRAGTKSMFSGTQDINTMGWYEKNSYDRIHIVGCKSANAWGLYDMHGNVFEWCLDEYNTYPCNSITDPCGISPSFSEAISNNFFVKENILRGGSWLTSMDRCRSASRGSCEPSQKSTGIGFRLVLVCNAKMKELSCNCLTPFQDIARTPETTKQKKGKSKPLNVSNGFSSVDQRPENQESEEGKEQKPDDRSRL